MKRQKFVKTCLALLLGNGLVAACSETIPTPSLTPISLTIPSASSIISNPTATPTEQGFLLPTATSSPPTPTSVPPTATNPPTPPFAELNLDLATKVGQRMLVVFPGTELTPAISRFLIKVRPGGIVIFGDNISSLAQIKQLNKDLQDLAAKNNLPPFIIAIDEEGGIVSRMPASEQNRIAPSQMSQAAGGIESAKGCARETANRLLNLGFNLNLAPIADINSNPANPVIGTRSYGSDPSQVGEAVRNAVQAYLTQGLGACVKHFPGHGDTDTDSHTGLPTVMRSRADLERLELVPFKAAIAAGVPAIMTGHIVYPQIETKKLPATLSSLFLKQILRDELKFEGLIITDSLSMGAISNEYGLAEAAQLSLQAGADMVIAIGGLADQTAVFERLLAAAQSKKLEVEASLKRILAYKGRFAVNVKAGQAENTAQFALSAEQAVTVLRNEQNLLPIKTSKPLLINFTLTKASQVEGLPRSNKSRLGDLWREQFPTGNVFDVSSQPSSVETKAILDAVKQAELAVVVTRDAYNDAAQARLVRSILELNKSVIIAAIRAPYDIQAFPMATHYVVTYGDGLLSNQALIAALRGTKPIQGRLPVDIPNLFRIGNGL